jgi:membrane-bound serine protease (ClpP class)
MQGNQAFSFTLVMLSSIPLRSVRIRWLLLFGCLMVTLPALSQQKKVMTMEIKNEIDPRMTRYVETALKHAREISADIIIIDLDTYGGVLTDAKDIVDQLMDVKQPIWIFINSDAASAGALIAIACDSIYMSPGASIGAATVVDGSGARAPDKYQSYMRAIMRATAEENHRNPTIAEGMVDEAVELDSLKKPGQVITFSTSEAIHHGYCEGKVSSIEEILQKNGINDYTLEAFEPSWGDKVVAFFLNPFISGVLILIVLAGIYFEMQAPGLGFPALASIVALVLYLVPYYLNGLAENWEIIAFFVGLGLLGLEIFVIPGFGVAGFAGITLTILSLVLIMINNEAFDFEFVRMNDVLIAMAAAVGGLLGGAVVFFVGGAQLANSRFFKRVALTTTQDSAAGYTSNVLPDTLAGEHGIAFTVLRPSGKVQVGDQVYDAFTRGEYIDAGQPIEVVSKSGPGLLVRRLQLN